MICTGDTGRELCCHCFNNLPSVTVVAQVTACYPADSGRRLQETERGTVEGKMGHKNTKGSIAIGTQCGGIVSCLLRLMYLKKYDNYVQYTVGVTKSVFF